MEPVKGKREKTPDDVILKIVEMKDAGEKDAVIARELGLSTTTVYRYVKEFGLVKNPRGTKKKKAKAKVQNVIPFITYTVENLEVGLIAGRHDLPVDNYIFKETISPGIMFNYDKLDSMVLEFINKNIKFEKNENGEIVANKNLIVYITGLSCVQTSVIKVCNERKVNLTFMHHHASTGEFIPQVVWSNFGRNISQNLFYTSTNITLYNCDTSALKDKSTIYFIKTIDFKSKNKNMRNIDTIVFSNENNMFKKFGECVSILMSQTSTKKTLYAYKGEIRNGRLVNETKINQFSNFNPTGI